MKQEELLQLNICPFDYGAISDRMEGKETEGEEKACFILMLRYLALLIKQCRIAFSVPQITEYLNREQCRRSCFHTGFSLKRQGMMKEIQKEILLNSGWSYGKGRLEEQQVSDLDICSLHHCSTKDWKRAALQIPEIFEMQKKGFRNVSVTVFWNERIGRYHGYADANPEEIKRQFQKEAELIERILRKLADPYAIGSAFCCYAEGRYIMGHFEGNSDECEVSEKDMDYNFFVQAIILHMLLLQAEGLFGIPKWEVCHEA